MSDPVRILCVDDDANVLSAHQRTLRKLGTIDVAPSAGDALQLLSEFPSYAVIISDRNMPGVDGIRLLAQARAIAPDTVRIMLTGDDQRDTAVAAVNQGHIFRFLSKPCPAEELVLAVEAGIAQYRLITAERELLEKTLAGAIGVLTEILTLMDDESFGKVQVLRRRMRQAVTALKLPEHWEMDVAVMLARIGTVTVPRELLKKVGSGRELSATERDMIERIPETGSMLVANIPRLEAVSLIVLNQRKRWDGGGFPQNSMAGDLIPLGARLLRIVEDLVEIEATGADTEAALVIMSQRQGIYDPGLLGRIASALPRVASGPDSSSGNVRLVALAQLRVGWVLKADVLTQDGTVLITAGHTVTAMLQERLDNFSRLVGVVEPLLAEPPSAKNQEGTRP
jgi:response regulator RpfG family c-di-GMP phosphodiesterase